MGGFIACAGKGGAACAGKGIQGCCGCKAQTDCSAIGGALLGAEFNASNLLLKVGGTGDPAAPFPRYPRWSKSTHQILPSVRMWKWCASLIVYSDAYHNGATYILNNQCASVIATAYAPRGAYKIQGSEYAVRRKIRHRAPLSAYDADAQRFGYAYDAAMNAWIDSGFVGPRPVDVGTGLNIPMESGYNNPYSPFQIGNGSTKLYGTGIKQFGGLGGVGYWWKPSAQNLIDIYGVASGFAPAAGVKHTLILYIHSWRSKYKTLNWDGVSWPAWWTAAGVNPAGAAAYELWWAQPMPRALDISSFGTDAETFFNFLTGGGGFGYGKQNSGQWPWEEFFANSLGYATDPAAVEDSRVKLLAAHVICQSLDNVVIDPVTNFQFPTHFNYPAAGGTVVCNGNTDIKIIAETGGGMFAIPAFGAGWVTAGTPYKVTGDCWQNEYWLPLHFTGFTSPRSTTMIFGGRTYTIQQNS